MTNPVALPKTHSNSSTAASNSSKDGPKYYEGNVQLLEARFLQLTSSIRALYRSVEELRAFCKNPDTQDEADHVVVEAIFENLGVLRKQRRELVTVVAKMNYLNAHTNVPDDIRIMVLGDEEEDEEKISGAGSPGADEIEQSGSSDAGVYL